VVHSSGSFGRNGGLLECLAYFAKRRKVVGMPFNSVSLFVSGPWDEDKSGPMDSCRVLEGLRACVERLEIVVGNDALNWNLDDYFFL
jgi:hypothetical protein